MTGQELDNYIDLPKKEGWKAELKDSRGAWLNESGEESGHVKENVFVLLGSKHTRINACLQLRRAATEAETNYLLCGTSVGAEAREKFIFRFLFGDPVPPFSRRRLPVVAPLRAFLRLCP